MTSLTSCQAWDKVLQGMRAESKSLCESADWRVHSTGDRPLRSLAQKSYKTGYITTHVRVRWRAGILQAFRQMYY
jgi:hypothetical protein